ncbi:F-box protein At5g51370-like [Quercus lobata]|nr:F-box protein At5g51370-like [Quercus lobata]
MSHSPNPNDQNDQNPDPSRRSRSLSLPEFFFKEKALKHVILKMHHHHHHQSNQNNNHNNRSNHNRHISLSPTPSPPSSPEPTTDLTAIVVDTPAPNPTSLLSDNVLNLIFSKLPVSQYPSNSLVCRRWLYLHGRLVQSLKLFDWSFLDSGRLFHRFPNLSDVDIVHACIRLPRNAGIIVTRKYFSVHLDSSLSRDRFVGEEDLLPSRVIDSGLKSLAESYPNLRRLVVIGASVDGLSSVAKECQLLQELDVIACGDLSLKGISGCMNLQIVKLIGFVDGFFGSVVSDIGLTILAQGCRRLVRLELCGCEGSYDGIKAIGQCCQMLEELTLSDHKMDGGWLAAVSFCGNLKILKLQSCKGSIDSRPGPDEHLGSCPALEALHLQRCQMRDKQAVRALFLVCRGVREIVLQDCYGLGDEVFGLATVCRRVRQLSLEGCSLLTVEGLESVILSWKDLQRLRVVSCNKIMDSAVTPALATLFSVLKELKWSPDSRSLLSSSLAETDLRKKGGRFFRSYKG